MTEKYQILNINILLLVITINLKSETLNAKIKQKGLVDKSAVAGFINNTDLNKKVVALAKKPELKAVNDKIVKLEIHDLNYFLAKNFLMMVPRMFVYQPTFNTLELKIDKGIDCYCLEIKRSI